MNSLIKPDADFFLETRIAYTKQRCKRGVVFAQRWLT